VYQTLILYITFTQKRIPNMWYTDDTLEYDKEYLQYVLELFQ